MRWCTAVGAWGDSFVSLGSARAKMQEAGVTEFGMVHYGFDPHISTFLSHQPGVSAVKHVRPENKAAYHYALSLLGNPTLPLSSYAETLLRGTGIEARECQRTHVYHLNYRQAVHRFFNPVLPVRSLVWAEKFIETVCEGKPFVMLHPFSTQSSTIEGHWPYWKAAAIWLSGVVADCGGKVVWTGTERPFDVSSPHLVNAVGLTPSMLEVFALQRMAALTVSTSNGCAHWAVMDKKPAVVCCNNHMLPEHSHIFKEWISVAPVVQVEYREKMAVFQGKVCQALTEAGL